MGSGLGICIGLPEFDPDATDVSSRCLCDEEIGRSHATGDGVAGNAEIVGYSLARANPPPCLEDVRALGRIDTRYSFGDGALQQRPIGSFGCWV